MTRFALAALSLFLTTVAQAQTSPKLADKQNCFFTLTPSSTTATQLNSAARLDGSACTDYTQFCLTLDDASTQRVYISSHNASVAPGGAISAAAAFPIYGGSPGACFDWARNVAIWAYMKATQTPVANTLHVVFSR